MLKQGSSARSFGKCGRTLAWILAAASVFALAACAKSENKSVADYDKQLNDFAQKTDAPADTVTLYKNNCLSCHGYELEGRVMQKNANLQHVGKRLTKTQIMNKINNGGGGMIAFKSRLSEREIAALADWLSTLQ